MAKRFVTILAIAVLATVALFAAPAEVTADESYGECYAYTTCPRGGSIYCRVAGNSSGGVRCSWFVRPGVSVECHGYVNDPWGNWMWQDYYYTCGY